MWEIRRGNSAGYDFTSLDLADINGDCSGLAANMAATAGRNVPFSIMIPINPGKIKSPITKARERIKQAKGTAIMPPLGVVEAAGAVETAVAAVLQE